MGDLNNPLVETHYDRLWWQECDDCGAKGIKGGMLCGTCQGRCYVPHDHQPDDDEVLG